jgi:hypothetical protein
MKSLIQLEAERRLQGALRMLQSIMPPKMGIALFVFEHHRADGHFGYVSNGERQDMRRALAEFLSKWDADAKGAPFNPLTLDAFEAWAISQAMPDVARLVGVYRALSNSGVAIPSDVETKHTN